MVRRGKGQKDRVTVLAQSQVGPLQEHLTRVKGLYEQDREHDPGLEWACQYVFPADHLSVDPATRTVRRGHMNRTSLHNAVKAAARKAGIAKTVSCHSLRHSFASHLMEDGCHILTIQELLGHAHQSTTMIYTHPLNRPGLKSRSPLDALRQSEGMANG